MNDKLYAAIKLSLLNYDFNKDITSFNDLYEHSRQFKHGRAFKDFVRICKNMGVRSQVKRVDAMTTKRFLTYDQSLNAYINKELEVWKACPACSGSGVVATEVE